MNDPHPIVNNAQNPVAATFESLVRNNAEDDSRYIYIQSSGVAKTEGGFSHLFTTQRTNASTIAALQKELVAKYGDEIGNAVSSGFKADSQMTLGEIRSAFKMADMIQINRGLEQIVKTYGMDVGSPVHAYFNEAMADGKVLDGQMLQEGLGNLYGADFLASVTESGKPGQATFGDVMNAAKDVQKYTATEKVMAQLAQIEGPIPQEKVRSLLRENFNKQNVLDLLEPTINKENYTLAECRDIFQMAGKTMAQTVGLELQDSIMSTSFYPYEKIESKLGLDNLYSKGIELSDVQKESLENTIHTLNTFMRDCQTQVETKFDVRHMDSNVLKVIDHLYTALAEGKQTVDEAKTLFKQYCDLFAKLGDDYGAQVSQGIVFIQDSGSTRASAFKGKEIDLSLSFEENERRLGEQLKTVTQQKYVMTNEAMKALGNQTTVSSGDVKEIIADKFGQETLKKMEDKQAFKAENYTRAECRDLFQRAGEMTADTVSEGLLSVIPNAAFQAIVKTKTGLNTVMGSHRELSLEEVQKFKDDIAAYVDTAKECDAILNEIRSRYPNGKNVVTATMAKMKNYVSSKTPVTSEIKTSILQEADAQNQYEINIKNPDKMPEVIASIDNLNGVDREAFIAAFKAVQSNFPNDPNVTQFSFSEKEGYRLNLQFENGLRSSIKEAKTDFGYSSLTTPQAKTDYLTAMALMGEGFSGLIIDNLAALRAAQPTGPLTKETMAKVLLGKSEIPEGAQTQVGFHAYCVQTLALGYAKMLYPQLKQIGGEKFKTATQAIDEAKENYEGGFATTLYGKEDYALAQWFCDLSAFSLITTYGMKPDVVISRLVDSGSLTQNDFSSLRAVNGGMSTKSTVADGLDNWLINFHRQGEGTGIFTTIKIEQQQGKDALVLTNDTSDMNETEKKMFNNGEMIGQTELGYNAMRDLCTANNQVNEKQLCTLLFALSQNGPVSLLREPSTLVEGGTDEHTPCDYTVGKDDSGNITLHVSSKNTTGTHLVGSFIIAPDGSSECKYVNLAPSMS